MHKISIYLELALTYSIFLAIAYFYQGPGLQGNIDKVLSIATFLFAVNLGFSIANRKSRLDSIRSLLRKNDALILTVYEASKVYGKEITDKTRTLIDNMLIKQIDCNLVDFDKTTPELIELFQHSQGFKITHTDEEPKKTMVDSCRQLLLDQKEIIYWVKDKMMLFEWISLVIFGAIMIICVYALSDRTILSITVLPLAATAIVLLIYVLRDINNLGWQEENWIWNPLIDLFQELDLPPYLLAVLFRNGRLDKKKLNLPKEYRLVEYAHPYPDISDKTVTLIKE